MKSSSEVASDTPVPGALFSVNDGEGNYCVAKVLAADSGGVHLRLFKNKYANRPSCVDPSTLDLGSVHDPDGFGIGHMPLSHSAFHAWLPQFLFASSLGEDELEGYRYWLEAGGGYFGGPDH